MPKFFVCSDLHGFYTPFKTALDKVAFDPHIRKEAANKLEQLQELVDGLLGDHYVDYLDYYTSYCRELEEKLDMIEAV